jgi:hypothetical protein
MNKYTKISSFVECEQAFSTGSYDVWHTQDLIQFLYKRFGKLWHSPVEILE